MNLRQSLANSFTERHPREAAVALETRPPEEIVQIIQELRPDKAAAVLSRMSPGVSARTVELLDTETAARIFIALESGDTTPLLRRLPPEIREAIIGAMPAKRARALTAVLRFPDGTAGAVMDPHVVALPVNMNADEAIKAIRREVDHARFSVYVIDRDGRLVGVLELKALIVARPKDPLGAIMGEALHRLSPSADRLAIVRHPGWRVVHDLPVVDRDGRLLGAIGYSVMRAIEDEIYGSDTEHRAMAAQALGDLFWAGVGGVLETISAAVSPAEHRTARRAPAPAPQAGGQRPLETDERGQSSRNEEE